MKPPTGSWICERHGQWRIWRREHVDAAAVVAALSAPGNAVKTSPKFAARRVADWFVKASRGHPAVQVVRYTLLRERYRRAWRAAATLSAKGVHVPEAIAYAESGKLGFLTGNILISEFLDGFVTVEQFAKRLAAEEASPEELRMFFADLAEAVNGLTSAGAFHADLSGKNILTRDGASFYFVDLDDVTLGTPYTASLRKRNHVQLYDSFCDDFDDRYLAPFLSLMLPEEFRVREWVPAVKEAQTLRRKRHMQKATKVPL